MAQEEGCQPVTKLEINSFATVITSLNGEGQGLGKNWVNRFLSRHPRIKMKPSRLIEVARKTQATEEGLREYYSGLDLKIKEKLAGTDRIKEGETHGGRVAGTALTTVAESVQSDATAWISIPQAIGADGRRLTPWVVFTGQWFPPVFPDCK
jgi:4-hydroxybenzoate polyprenyltransferase